MSNISFTSQYGYDLTRAALNYKYAETNNLLNENNKVKMDNVLANLYEAHDSINLSSYKYAQDSKPEIKSLDTHSNFGQKLLHAAEIFKQAVQNNQADKQDVHLLNKSLVLLTDNNSKYEYNTDFPEVLGTNLSLKEQEEKALQTPPKKPNPVMNFLHKYPYAAAPLGLPLGILAGKALIFAVGLSLNPEMTIPKPVNPYYDYQKLSPEITKVANDIDGHLGNSCERFVENHNIPLPVGFKVQEDNYQVFTSKEAAYREAELGPDSKMDCYIVKKDSIYDEESPNFAFPLDKVLGYPERSNVDPRFIPQLVQPDQQLYNPNIEPVRQPVIMPPESTAPPQG